MSDTTSITKVSESELSKVKDNLLKADQLDLLFKKTPAKHIYERPAKGGGKWKYVTGIYVKKVLNLMFGWDWDFEVGEFSILHEAKQVIVLGKLTCRMGERKIIKQQFGRADIKYKKDAPTIPMDLGNDCKAATTDALKKCASELGIAGDIYGGEEFKEIRVEPSEEAGYTDIETAKKKLAHLISNMDGYIQKSWHKKVKEHEDAKELDLTLCNFLINELQGT